MEHTIINKYNVFGNSFCTDIHTREWMWHIILFLFAGSWAFSPKSTQYVCISPVTSCSQESIFIALIPALSTEVLSAVCTNTTSLCVYKQHDMQCYGAMQVASIILEAEVMIRNPQCATTVSARLEHFLHCKYCSQFSDHMKLLSRPNCLFSRFNSDLTPFYVNYFLYRNSQLLCKRSSEIGFYAAK